MYGKFIHALCIGIKLFIQFFSARKPYQNLLKRLSQLRVIHGQKEQTIEHGERVAQFLITPVLQPAYEEVEELTDTDRGIGGFGSTGK